MAIPPLVAQTTYAELVERCSVAAFTDAFAKAGVFRLRGVLVGTVAYQTYAAMLGIRPPLASLQTEDIDIAQFKNVSVAVEDRTPPMLAVLQQVDKTFRAVSHIV